MQTGRPISVGGASLRGLAWAVPVESQTAMRCACWRATRHLELRYMYLVYERLASILPCIPIPHHSHSLRVPRRASNRHHSISLGISAASPLKTWSTPHRRPDSQPSNTVDFPVLGNSSSRPSHYLLFLKMQNLLGHSKTKPALVHSQHKLSRFFRHPGVTTSSSTLEDSSLRLQPCLVSLKIDE